jgi:hypothetical protein
MRLCFLHLVGVSFRLSQRYDKLIKLIGIKLTHPLTQVVLTVKNISTQSLTQVVLTTLELRVL